MYCVYLTSYQGNKLPQFYIGSTSIEKIKNGYRGTVSSKKYSYTFRKELLQNPQLFRTFIICTASTRKEALHKENLIQRKLNVVKSSMYINESFASANGFFGRDDLGELNGFYGKTHSEETKAKMRKPKSEETKAKMRKPKSLTHRQSMSKNNGMHRPEMKEMMRQSKLGRKRLIKNGVFKCVHPNTPEWNLLINDGYTPVVN